MGTRCHAVPLLGHFIGCLFIGGFPLFTFPISLTLPPQFAHLNAMHYMSLWIFTEFLLCLLPCHSATSGILHPQSLSGSQCPHDSAQPASLRPPMQTHWVRAEGTPDLQPNGRVRLSEGSARRAESAPGTGCPKGFHLNPQVGGRGLEPPQHRHFQLISVAGSEVRRLLLLLPPTPRQPPRLPHTHQTGVQTRNVDSSSRRHLSGFGRHQGCRRVAPACLLQNHVDYSENSGCKGI